jgi:acyl carrier protein
MTLSRNELMTYLSTSLHVDIQDLADDAPLFSAGRVDSFAVTDLILFVEESIGHRLPAPEVTMDNFDSIAAILALAERQIIKAEGV